MVLFLSILVYFGRHDSKPSGAVGKWGPISKKFWTFNFFAKGKNLAPRQVENPK